MGFEEEENAVSFEETYDRLCARYMRQCDEEMLRELTRSGVNEVRSQIILDSIWHSLATKLKLQMMAAEERGREAGYLEGFRSGLRAHQRQETINTKPTTVRHRGKRLSISDGLLGSKIVSGAGQ